MLYNDLPKVKPCRCASCAQHATYIKSLLKSIEAPASFHLETKTETTRNETNKQKIKIRKGLQHVKLRS